jgi:hypothetical protein
MKVVVQSQIKHRVQQPEQGRFGSRPLSETRSLPFGASPSVGRVSGAWDPFVSRSSMGPAFPGGEGSFRGSLGPADINLGRHSRSSSRRESSVIVGAFPSGGDTSFDGGSGNLSTQALAEDFAFACKSFSVRLLVPLMTASQCRVLS